MLPDWPKTKSKLRDVIMAAVERRQYESAPMASQVGRRIYHEGRGGVMVREDGEEDPTDLKESSAVATFEGEELGTLPLKDVYERYLNVVAELSEHQERAMIEAVDKAVARTGNTVNAKGGKMSPELILEAFETVQVSFGPNGMPKWPTFFIHPDASESVEAAMKQLDEEPYRSQLASITERKRRDWHDREGRRQLVG